MKGIEIKGITKRFGDVTALDDIQLTLEAGKIYGLLGRNGAGKSTLLNLITNRIYPTVGSVAIDGADVVADEAAIANTFLMTTQNLYPDSMKVKDAFKWSAEFYPSFDRVEAQQLAQEFKLPEKKKIKNLSTGYQSLFKLIVALSCNAEYIFLDEPVLGLDANNRDRIYKYLIEKFVDNHSTIILSTHIIEEVSGLIEEVIIIDDGKVLAKESVEEMLAKYYQLTGPKEAIENLKAGRNVIAENRFGSLYTVTIEGVPEGITGNVDVSRPNLQDLFIHLTQDEERIQS